MYMSDANKEALATTIGRLGGSAVSLLAECTGEEASHPDTYCAGYLQGYAHAIDAACHVIYHAEEV